MVFTVEKAKKELQEYVNRLNPSEQEIFASQIVSLGGKPNVSLQLRDYLTASIAGMGDFTIAQLHGAVLARLAHPSVTVVAATKETITLPTNGGEGSIMTQTNNAVSARKELIIRGEKMESAQLITINGLFQEGGYVREEGDTELAFYMRTIDSMEDEQVTELLKIVYQVEEEDREAAPAPVPLPEEPKPEVLYPVEKVVVPWALKAVKNMPCLSKSMLISFLRVELKKEANKEDFKQIEATIAKLSADDVYWEARMKPFVMKARGWNDQTPGTTADMLAKMGLTTQRGVGAATNWTGDQLVKLGNLMKRNSEKTGKVVASPFFGLARAFAKKPTTTPAPTTTGPVSPTRVL